MDSLLKWVSELDEENLRIFVARCLNTGVMSVEKAAVQLHHMRFAATRVQFPWRTCASLQSTLCALPSSTCCEFLSPTDCVYMFSLSTLIANHLQLAPILRTCCAEHGITVPHTFTDVASLKVLCRFAQQAPGVPWTLECEGDVREVVQVSKLVVQDWVPADGVIRRVAFSMDAAERPLLDASIKQFMSGGPQRSEVFSFHLQSTIVGFSPDFLASLYIDKDNDHSDINCPTSVLWVDMNHDIDPADAHDTDEMDEFYSSQFQMYPVGFDTQAPGYDSKPDGSASIWLYCQKHDGDLFLRCPMFAKLIRILVNGGSILCVMRQQHHVVHA